jgi:hypothetical protein
MASNQPRDGFDARESNPSQISLHQLEVPVHRAFKIFASDREDTAVFGSPALFDPGVSLIEHMPHVIHVLGVKSTIFSIISAANPRG